MAKKKKKQKEKSNYGYGFAAHQDPATKIQDHATTVGNVPTLPHITPIFPTFPLAF
jgi:hypothetical protein